MKSSCNETEKLAPLAVGGDLDSAPLEALREHVQGCPACTEVMRAAEAARAAYRSALPDAESVDLWPGLRERLASESRPDAGVGRRSALRRLPPLLRATGGLAAAAALVFLARPWFSSPAGPGVTITDATIADATIPGATITVPVLAVPTAASASAFPAQALRGVSARPAGEVPSGTLAQRPAPSPAEGLTRIEGPTMGEELRQQAMQQPQGGLIFVGGGALRGQPGSGAQAASGRSWRR